MIYRSYYYIKDGREISPLKHVDMDTHDYRFGIFMDETTAHMMKDDNIRIVKIELIPAAEANEEN